MPTLVDLPGTQSPKEYESCSSATGAIKALRKGLAATASGDRGAINLWRDDTGQLRGERFRFLLLQESAEFGTIASARIWYAASLKTIEAW